MGDGELLWVCGSIRPFLFNNQCWDAVNVRYSNGAACQLCRHRYTYTQQKHMVYKNPAPPAPTSHLASSDQE